MRNMKHNKNLIKFLMEHKGYIVIWLIAIFIVLNGIFIKCLNTKIDKLDSIPNTIEIICSNNSISSINIDELKAHNQNILMILNQRNNRLITYIMDMKSSISQGRMIYFMLLVAIITFILAGSEANNNKSLRTKTRNALPIFLVAIILMYFVEIHIQDQLVKPSHRRKLAQNAVEKIVNTYKEDNVYYSLCFEDEYNILNERDKNKNKIRRKLFKMLQPDIIQIIFYLIPGFLFISYYLYREKVSNWNSLSE